MHTGTLRKLALALTFWLALHMSSLRAQTFTAPLQASTTGTNSVDFEFRADGTLIAKGRYGIGSLLSTDQGAGTRMLWFPSKGAFRAGSISSSGYQWDTTYIGNYSTAFGYDTIASGKYSTASGYYSSASGKYSVAFGCSTSAYGPSSAAFGSSTTAGGYGSMAVGYSTTAGGNESIAAGWFCATEGQYSQAFGFGAQTNADYSTAFGQHTQVYAYNSFVIGEYNVGGGSPTSWVATDPLFEIGNGTGTSAKADALVVYKNGNTKIYGTDNEMPNQTLVGANSVLTRGLADGRYLSVTGGSGGAISLSLFTGASAAGTDSVALGYNANASGNYAFAGGNHTTASGVYSSAFGANTTATAYGSTVLGQYNVGGGSGSTWTATDPLFEIGDGTSTTASDALVVYKNGNASVQGSLSAATLSTTGTVTAPTFVTTAPAGDIPMYTGH